MTLEQARTKAAAARESGRPKVFLGGPKDTRTRFEALALEYIKRGMIQSKGPEAGKLMRSAPQTEARIRRKLIPAWGQRVVLDLTRDDATKLLDGIVDKHGPGEARSNYQILMRILRWADERGTISRNPLEGLKPPHPKTQRDRVLTDDELAKVWEKSHNLGPAFGPFFRLLILTGCRRSEIAELHRSEVDMKSGVITIPAARSKNAQAHIVPMSTMVRDEIDALPPDSDFILSTNGGGKAIAGFGKIKGRLDDITGIHDWTIHDIRRTVRTGLARLGIPREVAERAIGHKPADQLEQTYDRHRYQTEIADALDKWAAHVRDITTPPPDNLTRLRAAQ